ncbi:MAG: phosphoenolpyruvate carboxykinase (ATP) [Deltaproteobacteria bacterium CG2_30_63_29]|nr:MAG: phosphoenolpyruvate carboxykinase (ATP) [Deltaproteobacteria bacterium CG2_30_63_29]
MTFQESLNHVLKIHGQVVSNPSRPSLVDRAVARRESMLSKDGALVTWTKPESTGRSPADTLIVRRPGSEGNIDWDAAANKPLAPETFQMLWDDAMAVLATKEELFVCERSVGADSRYALPLKMVTPSATHALFALNMFREVPQDIQKSLFYGKAFTLVSLPYDLVDSKKYAGRLRKMANGDNSQMVIIHDFDNMLGLVYGSAYCGSNKKLMFTAMNYLLPEQGILPLHCSANEGEDGNSALLLGLSGTGKTTLSADPTRALLGDDEHGWGEHGIANFENGCYAKLINLRQDKEPEIWNATFRQAHPHEHGALIENCMMFPNGTIDVDDERLTENSRVSFPLDSLSNIKKDPVSGHPNTVIFLTGDANGVLPPVAKLDKNQAMLWFLMGYTSKLAGTETGITEPQSTFSRFFGAPFMPRNPDDYASLLGEKINAHETQVYLVNTGWSGGAYGVGARMDISLTRAIVDAAVSGKLNDVEYAEDPLFHISVPKSCPGVAAAVLHNRNTWSDKSAYDDRAKGLAAEFSKFFDKAYGKKNLDAGIVAACPGK